MTLEDRVATLERRSAHIQRGLRRYRGATMARILTLGLVLYGCGGDSGLSPEEISAQEQATGLAATQQLQIRQSSLGFFQGESSGLLRGPFLKVVGELQNQSSREMDATVRFTALAEGTIPVGTNTTRPIWGPILSGQSLSFEITTRLTVPTPSSGDIFIYRLEVTTPFGLGEEAFGSLTWN